MVKKLLSLAFLITIVYLFIERFILGLYYVCLQSHTYISFITPILHWTKYLAVVTILLVLFKKYVTLTTISKKVIPILLTLSIVLLVISSLWFSAVSKEEIVKHRVFLHSTAKWEDVEYVSTEIRHEEKVTIKTDSPFEPSKVSPEYNIHLYDGSVMNVWNNLSSMSELHQYVLEKNIEVKYLTEQAPTEFDQNFTYYFEGNLNKAHEVFGIE
ncbi:hypothetical protein [Oceanobacillus kapialis]|uniref:Uncharacterized protein n=1 Tax=Oceanobacillus kapialis TaxID=481353 RepID=A0ABW5Q2J8_9BACI